MNQYWSAIQPVLVTPTYQYWSRREVVLVTTRSSTGHDADQYWFVSLSFRGGSPTRISRGKFVSLSS